VRSGSKTTKIPNRDIVAGKLSTIAINALTITLSSPQKLHPWRQRTGQEVNTEQCIKTWPKSAESDSLGKSEQQQNQGAQSKEPAPVPSLLKDTQMREDR
tara:strand:+ start:59 stop:358 length:300 start_codon:yes stop_codon:yes gene_type:complete